MANYSHIENEQITGVYDLYPDNWRNISNFYLLAEDTDALYNLGWRTIIKVNPTYNPDYQRLGNPSYTITDNEVYETLEVIDLPKIEIVEQTEEELLAIKIAKHNNAMKTLRDKRDVLLSKTDFTQLADIIKINGTELTQLYEEYRQALRDLPSSYQSDDEFIDESNVVYPTKPGDV
jgi:hypothetical protein